MSGATNVARKVAAQARERRTGKSQTMADLAKLAAVSVRMLVRIESPRQLEAVLRKSQTQRRQKTELARVLASIALALDVDPKKWLADPQCPLVDGSEELAATLQSARSRIATKRNPLARTPDILVEIQRAARARHPRQQRLMCTVMPYYPFALRFDGRPSFLEAVTYSIMGSISAAVRPEFQYQKDIFEALQQSPRSDGAVPQIVIGFLSQLQREFAYGRLQFETIPGFRVRLSFVTTTNHSGVSWRSIYRGGQALGSAIDVLAIRDSTADNWLRGVCGLDGRSSHVDQVELTPLDAKYDMAGITDAVRSHFAKTDRVPIFAVDEGTAHAVMAGLDFETIDLAQDDEDLVPTYPLGIAVTPDGGLGSVIRRILSEELFHAHAATMVEVYCDYVIRVLSQKQTQRLSKDLLRAMHDRTAPLPSIPSYLRVSTDTHNSLPRSFMEGLRRLLEARLVEHFHGGENVGRVVDAIVPASVGHLTGIDSTLTRSKGNG